MKLDSKAVPKDTDRTKSCFSIAYFMKIVIGRERSQCVNRETTHTPRSIVKCFNSGSQIMNTDIILQTFRRAMIYVPVSHQHRNLVARLELLGQLAILWHGKVD